LSALQPVDVPRQPNVPLELRNSPFTLGEARAAGLTLSALKGKTWRRLGSELYCWRMWREDKWTLLSAWQRNLPEGAVFSGRTAAAIHGLDFEPANPVEVIVSTGSSLRSLHGLVVRHCDLEDEELMTIRRLAVTTLERTLRDLCVQWPLEEVLVAVDMAVHIKLADRVSLWRHAQASVGRPGAKRLGDLARLAEPAESPMETRLRWLLLQAGLPRPEVQADLHDRQGRFVGRADLYFPAGRLVVEFDGGNHRERLVGDDRRQNQIVNGGFTVLRFTSADLHNRPEVVVAQVRDALVSARLAQNGSNPRGSSARFVQNGRFGLLGG